MKRIVAALIAVLASASSAAPQSLLHPMFADHTVLQRDQPIHVYGQAPAGTGITLHLGGASASARAGSDGRWAASLPAMTAGGPYILEAESASGEKQVVHDVLVGDVFLCTGQSNMAVTVRGAANAQAEIAAATDGEIRELTIGRTASATPLSSFATPEEWVMASPATAGDFSASCFYFARELRKKVRVPVGLVVAAWGGTRDRGWVSEEGLRRLGYFNDDLDMLDIYRRDPAAAQRRWDTAWENWWRGHARGEPWNGATNAIAGDWQAAPAQLGAWGEWPGLSLPDGVAEPGVGFVGQAWLATTVTLTAAQAAQLAVLDLGRVNEEDKSWINGHGVGGTSQQPAALHDIPAGVLHAGDNSIITNIFCSWKNCGLTGPDATRAIRFKDGSSAELDHAWHYQTVSDLIAPQLPWGPMHGATMQYNGMILPIGPYSVRGAIWYQGESNIYFAQHYQTTLTAMMADWRKLFGADLPFLIVQIPDYGPVPTKPAESLWSDVREAQRRTAAADARSGLVVTFDIGDAKLLHPTNKQEIGRRLAIAARHVIYGEAIAPSGPRALGAHRDGGDIVVPFADITGALVSYNGAPNAFELCGAGENACRYTRATIKGTDVVLADAAGATRVRYCWGDTPICTLSDASGLPAGPFELAVEKAR